jgi:hypothetical protein
MTARLSLAGITVLATMACPSTPRVQRAPPRALADVRVAAPARSPATPDLLHCDLESRTYEPGAPDDVRPSAPVLAGGGVLVAFTRPRPVADGGVVTELVTRRLDERGVLRPAVVVRQGAHASAPRIAAAGDRIRLVAASGARFDLLEIDASTGGGQADAPAASLPFWPEDMTAGPRGIVATHSTPQGRVVRRSAGVGASPDVVLPPSGGMPEPHEQLVASGASLDLVLFPTAGAVGLAVLTPGAAAPTRQRELFTRGGAVWGEASIAAGPSGFAVVRNGPEVHALTLLRFDAQGEPLGTPTTSVGSDPSHPRRHPRVAALGLGWVVSYWDGVGPSILRFDADGRAVGSPTEVRSGDERGGHTDARMVADERTLAVTWHVHEPEFSHGVQAERPRSPGARLGLFRCRDARSP